MIRFYIAGPMSGHADLNFPLFHSEAARLRALGYEVINPAEANGGADELVKCSNMTPKELIAHWRACMRVDIPLLLGCDGIAMLQGWERSKGAQLEHHIATELGMIVAMADEITERAPAASVAELAEVVELRTDWAAA